MARRVHDLEVESSDGEGLAIGKEAVELAAVGRECRSGVEQPAEDRLYLGDLLADAGPASEPFLQVGGGREMVGMGVCF